MRLGLRPLLAALLAIPALLAAEAQADPRRTAEPDPSPYVNAWDAVRGREDIRSGAPMVQQEILLPTRRRLRRALDRRGYDLVEILSYDDRIALVSVCSRGREKELEIRAPFELRFIADVGPCVEFAPAPQTLRPPSILYLD